MHLYLRVKIMETFKIFKPIFIISSNGHIIEIIFQLTIKIINFYILFLFLLHNGHINIIYILLPILIIIVCIYT